MHNVPLTNQLWSFSIHGNNAQIIGILEENNIKPYEDNYGKLYDSAIICHHNEIANYIESNYLDEKYESDCAIPFYNFFYFPSNYDNSWSQNNLANFYYRDFIQLLYKNGLITLNCSMLTASMKKGDKRLTDFLIRNVDIIPFKFFAKSDITIFSIENPNLKIISEQAFYRSINLTTVILPPSVKQIGKGAFQECCNWTKIDLGNVEVIEEYAFLKCIKLTSITIPSSVKTIKSCAFSGCENLSNIVCEDHSIKDLIDRIGFNDKINIFLKSILFKSWEEVFPQTITIKEIREKYSEKDDIPINSFFMTYNGIILEDDKQLQDYLITNYITLHFHPGRTQF